MYMPKPALSSTSLPLAGKALAYKDSRAPDSVPPALRPAPVPIDETAFVRLDGTTLSTATDSFDGARPTPFRPPSINHHNKRHINHRH
jgi:hypothetical protein